jgi:hypothetical protein
VAGVGAAGERELPAPWSELSPAPRGGWRALLRRAGRAHYHVRFLPPGAAPDDPTLREVDAHRWGGWSPDGSGWLYGQRDGVHLIDVASGADRLLSSESFTYGAALSADGQTLYTTHDEARVRRELITNFDERPR